MQALTPGVWTQIAAALPTTYISGTILVSWHTVGLNRGQMSGCNVWARAIYNGSSFTLEPYATINPGHAATIAQVAPRVTSAGTHSVGLQAFTNCTGMAVDQTLLTVTNLP